MALFFAQVAELWVSTSGGGMLCLCRDCNCFCGIRNRHNPDLGGQWVVAFVPAAGASLALAGLSCRGLRWAIGCQPSDLPSHRRQPPDERVECCRSVLERMAA